MLETTKYNTYKKDLPRLGMLKYQRNLSTQPDIISFLLDYYHDNELKNNPKQQSND